MGRTESWDDLTPQRKAGAIVGAVIQLVLAGLAWADLAKRPADDVKGPKPVWAVVIMVNFVGPLAYFAFGRRRDLVR